MRCRLVIRELDVLHLHVEQLEPVVNVCLLVPSAVVAALLFGHNLQNQT